MNRRQWNFARGLSKLMASLRPEETPCLCRGVPRARLPEGACDPDECISQFVMGGRADVATRREEPSEVEKYAPYQT